MRSSGILMHISSLPSKYGIGTFGEEAYSFVDFLVKSGQSNWQILPIGSTSYGDSPYQSFSTYAGNPYFIDLDMLCEDNLLEKTDYQEVDFGENEFSVDYEKLFKNRLKVLHIAFENNQNFDDINAFRYEHSYWIEDYALFMSLKVKFDLKEWGLWDDEIRKRCPQAIDRYRSELADEINFWVFVQYIFFKQWFKLKEYANENHVNIIGDLPIYIALDSADAWSKSEIFWFDEDLRPEKVAGCPPDYFSATGQLWGNPLYRWNVLEDTGFDWWIRRIEFASRIFNTIRIDHFRGFDSFYAIPYGETTALNGEWCEGPGMELFNLVRERLPYANIIAEDLGILTPSVKKLLENSGYPGMKILQFAFESDSNNEYLPHNYIKNCVAYTGTHDNDTLANWFLTANKKDSKFAMDYFKLNKRDGYNWGVIRGAIASIADLVIIPIADYLDLGADARMNTPSTLGGNWQWRLDKSLLNDNLATKIKKLVNLFGRLPDKMRDNNKLFKDL